MNLQRITHLVSFLGALGVLGSLSSAALARSSDEVTYRIDVQNVTAGNVLSPFLAFATTSDLVIGQVGRPATPGVAALAETGDRSVLTAELASSRQALTTVAAEGGPIRPGETRSVELTVSVAAVRGGAALDLLAMIGRSNDSFIHLGRLPLAKVSVTGTTYTVSARNYDAGSEENTGNTEDFGSGGHPTDAAEGLVSLDRGLNPRGNAPEIFGWGPTAALVSVTRIR